MPCTHEFDEKTAACADGYCPLCLAAEVRRLRGEAGPFICGTVGQPDSGGLHDGYAICPQFGSDYVAMFMKRAKD